MLSRYHRLSTPSTPVFFQTGTDEYGQKVATTATSQNYANPQLFADDISEQFKRLLTTIDAAPSVDRFIRTTESDHARTVQQVWNELLKKGHIYKGTYSGWYSVRDECFYNEGEVRVCDAK